MKTPILKPLVICLFVFTSLLKLQAQAPGNALNFDGVNDLVTCSALNPTTFTVEAWANTNSVSTDQAIVSTLNEPVTTGYELHFGSNGRPCITIKNGGAWLDVVAGSPVTAGAWNHLAATYDGSTCKLYVNGKLAASASATSYSAGSSVMYIGRRSSGSLFFNGKIDEVRVWNTVRTQTVIQNNIYNELLGTETGLKAYYNFNQTSGSTLTDATSTYNGTITEATWCTSGALCPISKAASKVTTSGFIANWTALTGATSYAIDVDDNSDFSSMLASDVSAGTDTSLIFSNLSLTPGTTYYYRVRALVNTWASSNSTVRSFIVAPGNALNLDGTNDYVNLGTLSPSGNFSTGFTFMGWVKYDAFNSWSRIIDIGNGSASNNILLANYGTTGTLVFSNYSGGTPHDYNTPYTFTIGKWVHVAATIGTDGIASVYINGQIIGTANLSVPTDISRANCYLGHSNWGADSYFKGSMDEVSLWKRALSASEIQSAIGTSLAGNETGLYAYYNFDQGTASGTNTSQLILNDFSGFTNGTLTNFALSGSTSNFVESYAMVVPVKKSATAVVKTKFTANWGAPALGTVEKYLLDVSTSSTFASFVTGYNALDCGTNLSKEVTGLTANTTYYYRVRAEKASVTGQGCFSDTTSVTTLNTTVTPAMSWANPADIVYGSALSTTQLNASASYAGNSIAGTYTYLPIAGTALNAGNSQKLTVIITPTDATNYGEAKDTVLINVLKATPDIIWANPADIVYGTPLSDTQLNATANYNGSNVSGTYNYSPDIDSVLNTGSNQDLVVEFIPADASNFNSAKDTVIINVVKADPQINWSNPDDIVYGTALSGTQLNATVNFNGNDVPGTLKYSPSLDSILNTGDNQDLKVEFIPTDALNYKSVKDTVKINVVKANPEIIWANPRDIAWDEMLGSAQLNAVAVFKGDTIDGTFDYTPGAGTYLNIGDSMVLTVIFTPSNNVGFNIVYDTVTINVKRDKPSINWDNPADITYGQRLSATQLNATASFDGDYITGTFTYTPDFDSLLNIGNNQILKVTFTPSDPSIYNNTVEKTVTINVLKVTPTITWNTPADITYGERLSSIQLNATASYGGVDITGTFTYTPDFDSLLNAGNNQVLKVTFTPTDTTTINTVEKTVKISVSPATPTITWNTPSNIQYGTLLSSDQLNATADVPGTFTYTPAEGTQLLVGSWTLNTIFTPTDLQNYDTNTDSVIIYVSNNPDLPSYCAASSSRKDGEYISNVSLGTIQNSSNSSTSLNYQNFTALSTNLELGTFDTATVNIGNYYPTDQVLVWIDWNQDGDFEDEGEKVYTSEIGCSGQVQIQINFFVPANAKMGKTRMRIRLHDAENDLTNSTPCDSSTWGEVEDYSVNIVAASTSMSLIAYNYEQVNQKAFIEMKDQVILRIPFVLNGCINPLTVSSFKFSTAGTSNPSSLVNAKVYYTGNSPVFSTNQLFGSSQDFAMEQVSVGGSQTLVGGTNYFWLCYDVSSDAIIGDTLNAQVLQATINGTYTSPNQIGINAYTIISQFYEVTQNTNEIYQGKSGQDIIGVKILNNKDPKKLTSLVFNVNGTTNANEVSNISVYSTGYQSSFNTSNQFGQTVSKSTGASMFAGNLTLEAGDNYIWFVCDLSDTAVLGHKVDANLISMTINGNTIVNSAASPYGERIVAGFNGQSLANFMPASMVIGQPDFYSQDKTIDQDGGIKANGVAISSKGMLAMVSQRAGNDDVAGGRVLLWNSIPENNGAPADIVIGQPNFTSSLGESCSRTRTSWLMGAAFSPDGNKLLVADAGNNRVLIFEAPFTNSMAASVVIGQTSFTSSASGCTASKLYEPSSVYVHSDGRLFIVDKNNNRVLIYNQIPTVNGAAADVVIGQNNFVANYEGCAANKFQNPASCTVSPDGKLIICDAGMNEMPSNSRVLVFNSIPTTNGVSADVVIGKPDFTTQALTTSVSDSTMFYPFGVSVSPEGKLAIGDYYSSRVLIYDSIPTKNSAKANMVLGQPNFSSKTAFYDGISERSMRKPFNIAYDLNGRLFVSGRDMNRIMVYGQKPALKADLAAKVEFINSHLVYTIKNNGSLKASNIVVNCPLPKGMKYQTYTSIPEDENEPYTPSIGTWNIGSLEPGAIDSLFLINIAPDGTEGSTIRATMNIASSDKLDDNLENNSAYTDVSFNIVWTGDVSNNWNDSANWSPNTIPSITQSVIIPANPNGDRFPEVFGHYSNQVFSESYGDYINQIYNVTIEKGAHLSIPDTCILDVYGNFFNLGDSSTNRGLITMRGNNLQMLKGKVTNLAISNAFHVKLAGNTVVDSLLTLISGKLFLENYNLKIDSNAQVSFKKSISSETAVAADAAIAEKIAIVEKGEVKRKVVSSYIVAEGIGKLIQTVDSLEHSFKVGTATSYLPVNMVNHGKANNYGVSLLNTVYENGASGAEVSDINRFIKASWVVEADTIGDTNFMMDVIWNEYNIGVNFNIYKCGLSQNKGAGWDHPLLDNSYRSGLLSKYRDSITSGGVFAVGDFYSRVSLKVAPVLTADTTDNDPLHDITLTYDKNPVWFDGNPIRIIMNDSYEVTDYTIDSTSITFPAKYFPAGDMDYYIQIEKTDFTDINVIQHINRVDQELSFNTIPNLVVNNPYTLKAESNSGLPVEYLCSDLNIASINADTLNPLATGTAYIVASQDGNEIYKPAINVQQVFTSFAYSQSITFSSLETKTYGDAPFTLNATGGASGNPVVYTSSDNTVATCTGANGSTLTIVGAGSSTITASQQGSTLYTTAIPVTQTLTVNKAPLTINVTAQNKEYDGTIGATLTEATLVGVFNGDDVTLNVGTATFADANVGTGKEVTASGFSVTGTKIGNYALSLPSGLTADITKATPLTSWSKPADIKFGTDLSGTQLNATAVGSGTFEYTPGIGTLLKVGNDQKLIATFTPTDAINFKTVKDSVYINVLPTGLSNALAFDGVNNYVEFTSINPATFTMEAWVNPAIVNKDMAIMSTLNEFSSVGAELHLNTAGNPVLTIRNGASWLDVVSPYTEPAGKWLHIVGTYDGATASLMVNGITVASKPATAYKTGSSKFNIGRRSSGLYLFNGKIDECRIWNKALTNAEVKSGMYTELSGAETGLLAYYQFNHNIAFYLPDITNNGNNAKLNNFALSGLTWEESYAMVVPVAKTASAVGAYSFTANWDAPATGTVDKYLLDVSSSNDFSTYVSGDSSLNCGTGLSKTISGLDPNTSYYYRVRADKASVTGQGGYSATMELQTLSNVFPITATACGSYNFNGTDLTVSGVYTDTLASSYGNDSIVELSLTVNPVYSVYIKKTIAYGQSYTFNGNILTKSGLYDALFKTVNGCDSAVGLVLTVLPQGTILNEITETACGSYTFNGTKLVNSGVYKDTLTSSAGADSIVVLTLTVNPVYNVSESKTIPYGETYNFEGDILTISDNYSHAYTTTKGCDSIINLSLTVLPQGTILNEIAETACGSYNFGGSLLTQSGIYKDTLNAASGADSIVVLTLTVNPVYSTSESKTISYGQTYNLGGDILSASGNYSHTFATAKGCDSIVNLTLTILPQAPIMNEIAETACGSYLFNGTKLTSTGVYKDTLEAVSGADSIVVLTLTVNPVYNVAVSKDIPYGQTYNFGNQTLTASGNYSHTFASAKGCDSIVNLTLNVLPQGTILNEIVEIACGSYVFNGTTLTSSGVYKDTLKAALGADSIVVLTLTVNPVYNSSVSKDIPYGQSYNFGGDILTASGNYSHTFASIKGCDSIVNLTLTILPQAPIMNEIAETACGSYLFNGTKLTSTGVYKDTLEAVSGADSIVVLTLTVNPVYNSSVSKDIPYGQSYNFGGETLTASGNYSHTFASAKGCDSIVNLTLNVLPQGTILNEIVEIACGSYVFNGTTLTSSGVYKDTLKATLGADSIVVLTLTVNPVYNSSLSKTISYGQTYSFGNQTMSTSGNYSHTFATLFGCDSIVNLALTVLPEGTILNEIAETACGSFDFNGIVLTQSGVYKDTLSATSGADSIVVLSLTVNPVYNTSISKEIPYGQTYTFGNQTLTASGNYSHTYATVNDCDSIVNLNLTVMPKCSIASEFEIETCNSYVWYGKSYSESGEYFQIFDAVDGCDSVVTLKLTIKTVDTRVSVATNTITAIESNGSYKWMDCKTGKLVLGETKKSFTTTKSGNYAAIVQKDGCVDTSACLTITVSGIDYESDIASVTLYPNPTKGLTTVKTTKDAIGSGIIVRNLYGQVVYTLQNTLSELTTIDITKLPSGTYFVEVRENGNVQRAQVTKQ